MIESRISSPIVFSQPISLATQMATAISMIGTAISTSKNIDRPPYRRGPIRMLGAVGTHPPSIDAIARSIADVDLPHPLLVDAARAAVAAGDPDSARARAEATARALLKPVINATGVLLHTNLGRAPVAWNQDAGYTNLELDLATGRRGSRHAHAATLLAARAAPKPRSSSTTARRRCSSCSRRWRGARRGRVARRGGGDRWRLPGPRGDGRVGRAPRRRRHDEPHPARRLRASDSPTATTDVALILKVHPSNYRIEGFTEGVEVDDARDARAAGRRRHRLGPARRRVSLAAGRPAGLGARRACGAPDARSGRRRRHVLGRQAPRRPAGRHHRRPPRRDRRVRAPSPRPGAPRRRADARGAAVHRARVPPARRTGDPVLADGDDSARRAPRPSARRWAPARSSTRRPSRARARFPAPRSRRSASRSPATTPRRSARDTPPVIARVRDDTTICDLRTVDPHDDDALGHALEALP